MQWEKLFPPCHILGQSTSRLHCYIYIIIIPYSLCWDGRQQHESHVICDFRIHVALADWQCSSVIWYGSTNKRNLISSTNRDTRYRPKVGQIDLNWDKSGTFLKSPRIALWSENIQDLFHFWSTLGSNLPSLSKLVSQECGRWRCGWK